jgi:hypothetical protein
MSSNLSQWLDPTSPPDLVTLVHCAPVASRASHGRLGGFCLEGFQAGLKWLTILRKRESFRGAFADFDFERVARFTPRRIDALGRTRRSSGTADSRRVRTGVA